MVELSTGRPAQPEFLIEGDANTVSDEVILNVIYYTDPLCSWSWAFEPHWVRLRQEMGERIRWRYCMGGLLKDWRSYNDPISDVASPAHMAARWYEVSQISGVAIDPQLWHDDAPASSYAACLAVKAAELQSATAGDLYLRRLREAVMLHRRNIAKRHILLEISEDLASDSSVPVPFDAAQFRTDLAAPGTLEALRADLRDADEHDIVRFPALVLGAGASRSILLVGYRPYESLRESVRSIAPDLLSESSPTERNPRTSDSDHH